MDLSFCPPHSIAASAKCLTLWLIVLVVPLCIPCKDVRSNTSLFTSYHLIMSLSYSVTLSNATIPASSAICIAARYGSNPCAYNCSIAK